MSIVVDRYAAAAFWYSASAASFDGAARKPSRSGYGISTNRLSALLPDTTVNTPTGVLPRRFIAGMKAFSRYSFSTAFRLPVGISYVRSS